MRTSMPRKVAAKWLVLGLAVLVLVPGIASASNMGFKKNFTYTLGTPSSNIHWVSVPYFYDPRAMMGASNICNTATVDSEDLGYNMNRGTTPTTVFAITRLNSTTGAYDQLSLPVQVGYCGDAFVLEEGRAYQITVGATGNFSIVGSHDDAAAIPFTKGATSADLAWISVPYHFMKPSASWDVCQGTAPTFISATDLANSFPTNRIVTVVRLNETTGAYDQYSSGGYCTDAFVIAPGQGYQVQLGGAAGAFSWSPSHY